MARADAGDTLDRCARRHNLGPLCAQAPPAGEERRRDFERRLSLPKCLDAGMAQQITASGNGLGPWRGELYR